MVPVSTHDFTLMSVELEAFCIHTCVKIEDVNVLLLDYTSKQMTTVRELNLIATFEHIGFIKNN